MYLVIKINLDLIYILWDFKFRNIDHCFAKNWNLNPPQILRVMSLSCHHCEKQFIHSRTHIGEKQFSFSLSRKAFSHNGSLTKHLRIHSGEKPYPCNQCPKAFSVNSGLKNHLRVHTGENPYPCNQCPKAFLVGR